MQVTGRVSRGFRQASVTAALFPCDKAGYRDELYFVGGGSGVIS